MFSHERTLIIQCQLGFLNCLCVACKYGNKAKDTFHMYHVLITVQDKCNHAQLDSCVFADSRIPLLRKQVNVSSLAQAISSFHFYQYDQGGSTQYRINDGGNDMYDNGNVVR